MPLAQPPSFADALADARRGAGGTCGMKLLYAKMPADLAAQVQDAMAEPAYTNPQIRRAIQSFGYEIPLNTVERHRRKECRCD